jgi:hypothetical protein
VGHFSECGLSTDSKPRVPRQCRNCSASTKSQLHPALERAFAERPAVVANVGCAEGYYAVGIALRLADTVVHAYDLAATARRMTLEAARLNGVDDRVQIHGRCRGFPVGTGLVVCDIEGAEGSLLDSAELRNAILIVETHEFVRPGVTKLLETRFSRTHSVELLEARPTESALLDWLEPAERNVALEEMRTGEQAWLAMWPRDEDC